MRESIQHSVVCFGEVLWDNLPAGRRAGGAPMNVAYHLHQLGLDSTLISRIGNDHSGEELMKLLQKKGISVVNCQIDDDYPTSEVQAELRANHEVVYNILFPAAWDFMEWKEEHIQLIQKSEAFVYGSLIARNNVSQAVLFQLLDLATYKVLDINLRAPNYKPEIIKELLKKADLLKLNLEELNLISNWFLPTSGTGPEQVRAIQKMFGIREILLTKGSKGASYYVDNMRFDQNVYTIKVCDTVGSGDAFLAAFLSKKLKNEAPELALDFACAMGSFIATHSGACPDYDYADLKHFIWNFEKPNQPNLKSFLTNINQIA